WFEIVCGLLLLLGVAVRGALLMLVVMLLSFSGVVLLRALAIRETGGLPFCSIQFDCGCGAGEMPVCTKLGENLLLLTLSAALLTHRCLQHSGGQAGGAAPTGERTCPRCGTLFSSEALEGLCP